MNPTHIGIAFGDNDFYNTFIPLLRVVGDNFNSYDFSTKEKFCELINKASFGFYIVCQNQLRHNQTEKELEHTQNYLQIKPKQVYFNEEIDALLVKNKGWMNSEFFAIKVDSRSGPYVYSA